MPRRNAFDNLSTRLKSRRRALLCDSQHRSGRGVRTACIERWRRGIFNLQLDGLGGIGIERAR
ncbi:hypothetical protein EC915_103375 [Pseudomonas sp. LP_7_YM]|nr:hypothetical protein EC915_103375 [Pseudomonas sp. LP_7_YM]